MTSKYKWLKSGLLCVFIGLAFNGRAQTFSGLGFKAGLNISNYYDTSFSDLSSRTSFAGGFYFDIYFPFSRQLYLQPEFFYSPKGFKRGSSRLVVDYFQFSLPVKAEFGSVLKKGVYAMAGPYLGFELNSSLEDENSSVSLVNAQNDIGLMGGLGFYLPFLENVFLEGRYSIGLKDTFKDTSGKNRVFSIMTGIQF